jgi:uncharacterized protein YqjF (DUF2071 family)
MAGEIERRLLVNYRVDPAALEGLVPSRFRLQLVDGYAVAGICLIRLGSLRPRGVPRAVGLRSENAAHRVAVEWEENGTLRSGVYIPRRDTASRLTVLLGGRAFPGAHHRARFTVHETESRLEVAFRSSDGSAEVDVAVSVTDELEGSRLFPTAESASRFFEQGSVGFSPGHDPRELEAVELTTHAWRVEPCRVESARSTFFEGLPGEPPAVDCALVMRKVPVLWNALPGALAAG